MARSVDCESVTMKHGLVDNISRTLTGPIARATLNTSGILTLRLAAQAGMLIVVARMLGATGFGAYSGIVALAVLLGSMATFGTHLVLLGEISQDPSQRDRVLPYALPTTILASSSIFVMYLFLALSLGQETGIGLWIVIPLGLAEIFLQPLIMLASVEHQAHGRIALSQLLITLPLLFRLIGATVVWVIQPENALDIFVLSYLAATGFSLLIALLKLPSPWPGIGTWRIPGKRELMKSAGFATLNLTALGPGELDKTLAVKLMPTDAAGVYAAGTRIVGAMTVPVMALLIAALPRLFREHANSTLPRSTLTPWILLISLGYGAFAGVTLWISAPLFADAFGSSYTVLEKILPWLAFAVPALSLRAAAGAILVSQSRPWSRAGFEVFGLLVLFLGATTLTIHLGISGMCLALILAEWTMAISGWYLILSRKPA